MLRRFSSTNAVGAVKGYSRMFCVASTPGTGQHLKKPKGRVGIDYEGFRLAKYLSHSGACSRSAAEVLISTGSVVLNDEVVTKTNMRALEANDVVFVDGDLIKPKKNIQRNAKVYLYHKRTGETISSKDEEGTKGGKLKSTLQLLQKKFPFLPRLIAVGRLDVNSEGLMILSDSPMITRAMEIPSNELVRVYRVRAHGLVFEDRLQKLRNGILVRGIKYRPMEIKLTRPGSNSWFEVKVSEGKNREIRKSFAAIGLTVNRIIRTQYGPYSLESLPPGAISKVAIVPELRKLIMPKKQKKEAASPKTEEELEAERIAKQRKEKKDMKYAKYSNRK